ncbi:MAG: C-GCAxxG-C-C family (seleno)protein [Thermoguttaceae bacterium]|nr:C-GCAxxG-C-C family (seleno)protein [Thermoguttaceae bacterium]
MQKLSRRNLITGTTGLALGSFALPLVQGAQETAPEECWKYVKLSPQKVAQCVYETYGTNGCLYGAFKGAVLEYASANPAMAQVVKAFPFVAFRCGRGGFARMKQLCGAVAGAVMFMNCFVGDFKQLCALTEKLGKYAAESPLPDFVPADDKYPDFLKVVAHGLTCREMGGAWMGKATAEQKKIVGERCKRHTASIMAKAVELLNEHFNCK